MNKILHLLSNALCVVTFFLVFCAGRFSWPEWSLVLIAGAFLLGLEASGVFAVDEYVEETR